MDPELTQALMTGGPVTAMLVLSWFDLKRRVDKINGNVGHHAKQIVRLETNADLTPLPRERG